MAKTSAADRGMKEIEFSAAIRDGIFWRERTWFRLEVEADATEDVIEECVREEILNNRLEWDWRPLGAGDES